MAATFWRGFCAVTAIALASPALLGRAAAADLSLSSQSGAQGSSLVLSAIFAPQASFVTGIQFDLQYDSSVMSVTAIAGEAARNSGKTLYGSDLAPDKKRFLIAGLNENAISGGALITLFVNVTTNASSGGHRLALSNVRGADPYGQFSPITGTDGIVSIQGTVNQAVRLQNSGVLNGASLLPGPVAPGEAVTLIGSDIGPASEQRPDPSPAATVLADTRVQFDGAPAYLLYARRDRIGAVVPYSVAGKASTQLVVTRGGQTIAAVTMPVVMAVPAIFTLDSSGVGGGGILNEDSTVNSAANPAARGSAVAMFATGAGQTNPAGIDGQLGGDLTTKPILPASVQIGGIDTDILYAGPAPGLISGVLQIVCIVPAGAPSGHAIPVFLSIGSDRSQTGVTVSVK